MRLSIEAVSPMSEHVWMATIDPQSLIRLAPPSRQGGRLSVALITNPSFDKASRSLQFDLNTFALLNLGRTGETVLLDSREQDAEQPTQIPARQEPVSPGDLQYLKDVAQLPTSLREIGEKLLAGVRAVYPGVLAYKEKSGKYVETPDNYWVVRVQPRAGSYRIIVYGPPEEYKEFGSLKAQKDMSGYTNFTISNMLQLDEGLKAILYAKSLKDRRLRR